MSLLDILRAREIALLHEDWRERPAALDAVLGADFVEVAGNGRITSRAQVVAWLLAKDPAARWDFDQWELRQYAGDVSLLRYHAKQILPQPSDGLGSWHGSLWGFDPTLDCWRLRYHQASRIS